MGGTMFGIGSPIGYPTSQLIPFGLSAYGTQAFGSNPSTLQQPFGQPLQQILQVLQIVPQQLQYLQQLEYVQQQQLQQLHQILQTIPAQLAQLHQLVQFVPQQLQQLQQPHLQQPFGQLPGPGGATNAQWWMTPQALGGQPGHVM